MKKYDFDTVFNYAMYYRYQPTDDGLSTWERGELIDDLYRCRLNGEKFISQDNMTDDEFFEFADEVAATYAVLC